MGVICLFGEGCAVVGTMLFFRSGERNPLLVCTAASFFVFGLRGQVMLCLKFKVSRRKDAVNLQPWINAFSARDEDKP